MAALPGLAEASGERCRSSPLAGGTGVAFKHRYAVARSNPMTSMTPYSPKLFLFEKSSRKSFSGRCHRDVNPLISLEWGGDTGQNFSGVGILTDVTRCHPEKVVARKVHPTKGGCCLELGLGVVLGSGLVHGHRYQCGASNFKLVGQERHMRHMRHMRHRMRADA